MLTDQGRVATDRYVVASGSHSTALLLPDVPRAAGTAEFAGFDVSLSPVRIRNLHSLMQQILPRMQFNGSSGKPWCGFRPMSVDGVPIIGATPVADLFVNTGHGHLGWFRTSSLAWQASIVRSLERSR